MKSNNFSPNSYEDETSDTLSTANSYMPAEASSFYQQFSEIPEPDLISPQNKIIRKKRNAYGKIDDDKRLKLLEAVQNGETLKSASKRLGINYSSAKSIIHTYRKEGRILKKSICSFSCPPIHLTQFGNALSAQNPHAQTSGTFSPFEFYPASGSATSFATPTSSSAAYGTSGALGHLALENQYSFEEPAPVNTQTSSFESIVQSSLKSTPLQPIEPVSPRVSIMHLEETATNSWGLLKNFDFYMNYSNSPLSGGKGNIYNGFSDSNNHKMNPREFESFSELINSFQDPNRAEEQAFKSTRFNPIQETKLMEESFAVNNNMTREDYRNLIESQCLLSDSLQKASYLNSLARFQNAAVSPINGWKQL